MDARFPTRYLNDRRVLRLSADQFRTWTLATAYSVTNRTDGVIEKSDLPLIPFTTDAEAAALVEAGLWKVTGKGWLILEFGSTQTSGAEIARLEKKRQADREYRARKRGEENGGEAPGSRPDVDIEVDTDVGNDVDVDVDTTVDDESGPDERQSAGSRADSRIDVDVDVGNDSQGKSKSKSKGSIRGGSQADLASFEMPTDDKAVQYREYIEAEGFTSPDDLLQVRPNMTPEAARGIWASAFPGWEVA